MKWNPKWKKTIKLELYKARLTSNKISEILIKYNKYLNKIEIIKTFHYCIILYHNNEKVERKR